MISTTDLHEVVRVREVDVAPGSARGVLSFGQSFDVRVVRGLCRVIHGKEPFPHQIFQEAVLGVASFLAEDLHRLGPTVCWASAASVVLGWIELS